MTHALGLRCRECGADYPEEPLHICKLCFGPLGALIRPYYTEGAKTYGFEIAALIDQGRIRRDESIVISITGNGYKTLEAVSATVASPFVIDARRQEFDALYDQLCPQARRAAAQP